jgi:spore maturation protein CgeB
MKIILFCRSLVSDWNHGSAHFLRGVVSELIARGVDVIVYEPKSAKGAGDFVPEASAAEGFKRVYPDLQIRAYDPATLDVNRSLSGADAVVVQAWTDPDVVRRIGEHHAHKGHYVLLFNDAHHRVITEPETAAQYDLQNYDGVLAFGRVIRDSYLKEHIATQAWTWHEAADTRLFVPEQAAKEGDLVWIGNWGDGDRTAEMREYVYGPVRNLGIRAKVFGAGFPSQAVKEMERAGIEYAGWIPNYQVPETFAKYRLTVHVPHKVFASTVPGIPTIRVFEALACGIPLISAPWNDSERLFTRADFLTARSGEEMEAQISWVLHNEAAAKEIASHGRGSVLEQHTCSHRADELLQIIDNVQREVARRQSA